MKSKAFALPVIALSLSAAVHPCRGASIVWGPATTISSDLDVSTLGNLIAAVNIGNSSVPATTVNGVLFSPFVMDGVASMVTDSSGTFTLSAPNAISGFAGYGVAASPFSDLSSPYQSLLTNGKFTGFSSPNTLTINNLTIGQEYLFQVWVNDSRDFDSGSMMNVSAGNSVDLIDNTTDTAGGVGQFVVGAFIATDTTQTVVFEPNFGGNNQNGFQLRAIPEPSTGAFLFGGLTLAAAALRRRQR